MTTLARYAIIEPYLDGNGHEGHCIYALGEAPEFVDEGDRDASCIADEKDWAAIAAVDNRRMWQLPDKPDIKEPTDLKLIHDSICRYIRTYVWIRDTRAYDFLASWAILTYMKEDYRFMPLLLLDGATASGKSTLLEILESISYHGCIVASCSAPSIVRAVKWTSATVIIDEGLDTLTSDGRGTDVVNALKSVTSPSMRYMRAKYGTADDFTAECLYTCLAMSIKGANLAEDIINRGVRIQMLARPGGEQYHDYEDYDHNHGESYDPEDDEFMNVRQIRTALYAMRIRRQTLGPDKWREYNAVDLRPQIEYVAKALREKDKWGRPAYIQKFDMDYPEHCPVISNRLGDIVRTIIPVTLMTKTSADVMAMLIDADKDAKEAGRTSIEGETLCAMNDVILERIGGDDILRAMSISRESLGRIIDTITTRDIAQRLNDNLHDSGDLQPSQMLPTRDVTAHLKALGIPYQMGAAGGRQSPIGPINISFWNLYLSCLTRYDPTQKELIEIVSEADGQNQSTKNVVD